MHIPIHLTNWIQENRDQLKPPVGNKEVFPDGDAIVMVVAGPNARKDFHINETPEFFYQLEGDIFLRILEDGKPKDIAIREGEIFLLPGNVPHSPQRPKDTIGLVIEQKRSADQKDGFVWICDACHTELYREYVHVSDIEQQLPEVFERFYNSENAQTCASCGHTS